MRFRTSFRTAHRWLALALGLQIAAWVASGFALSLLPQSLIRGEASTLPDFTADLEARSYASPGGIIAQMGRATDVKLTARMGRIVYEARGPDGAALFDARTGARLSPLDEAAAQLIARQDFAGDEPIKGASRVMFEDRGPAWRIDFDDRHNTRLFVSTQTGEILARRNAYSRMYGFFHTLHVMDVSGRGNANNPLLQLMALTALGFVASGFCLIVLRVRDGRYRLRRPTAHLDDSSGAPATE